MMTFEPQGAHSPKITLTAQRALKSWGTQKPTIGEFPRPNRLLRAIASMGVGVLLLSGCAESAPTTEAPPTTTASASSSPGEDGEFARVCKDTKTGNRAEDSECERSNAPDTATASASAAPSSAQHQGSGSSVSQGSTTSFAPFVWYYIGHHLAAGGNYSSVVPAVGAPLRGGTHVMPKGGIMYRGVPAKGGSFEGSYKEARATARVSDGRVSAVQNGGKAVVSNKSGSGGSGSSGGNSGKSNSGNSGSSNKSGSGSSNGGSSSKSGGGSKGGFGGGGKSGGGSAGG